MKNEMTLQTKAIGSQSTGISESKVATTVVRMLAPLTRYYSQVLGTEVTIRQTLLLLNAQTAFLLTVFPAALPLLLRAGGLAWLVSALLKCRAGGIRTSC